MAGNMHRTRIAVVGPTRDRPDLFAQAVAAIRPQVDYVVSIAHGDEARAYAAPLVDALGVWDERLPNVSAMWNIGLSLADHLAAGRPYDVAVINDDATVPPGWFATLAAHLRDGATGASGPRSPRRRTLIAGYAFLLDGTAGIRADESLRWWYGDDRIQDDCNALGGFHIDPGVAVPNARAFTTSTGELAEVARADRLRYESTRRLDATVVVASYGDTAWRDRGDRAAETVPDGRVIRIHETDGTLAEVRNHGLAKVTTPYVVFLDADDEMRGDYLNLPPTADVLVTPIAYNRNRRGWGAAQIPKVWAHDDRRGHDGPCKPACLPDGNYIHVGAPIATETLHRVGGFREWPCYEDWDLYLRLYRAGATFAHFPNAAPYLAHQTTGQAHRNKQLPPEQRDDVHRKILAS